VIRSRSLIVAGAGIGGLSAAIALAKANYRVMVFERAPSLGESGAGLQLSPNATHALNEIGVLDAIRPHAIAPRALIIGNARNGRELARADLSQTESRYGAPWLVLARSDLHRALVTAAEDSVDVVIETGIEVTDFADHTRGVTASLVRAGESREETGGAIIGADGLRSRIRTLLFGKSAPRFHRLAAFRARIPAKNLPAMLTEPAVRLWFGERGHVVHYPVSGGEWINFVLIAPDEREAQDGEEIAAKNLPRDCRTWAQPLQDLISAAPSFRRWPLFDRPAIETWGKGHATLLGDAAHPMLPFVGQGAAAAIEDAVVLAKHLKNAEDTAPALRAYEDARMERTKRLQAASINGGRAYHAHGLARAVRDILLPLMGSARLLSRNDWIYRYRA
jgi:salicylate hydroxylase